jgi:hypothetical protein
MSHIHAGNLEEMARNRRGHNLVLKTKMEAYFDALEVITTVPPQSSAKQLILTQNEQLLPGCLKHCDCKRFFEPSIRG